jgi:hypothetical protein
MCVYIFLICNSFVGKLTKIENGRECVLDTVEIRWKYRKAGRPILPGIGTNSLGSKFRTGTNCRGNFGRPEHLGARPSSLIHRFAYTENECDLWGTFPVSFPIFAQDMLGIKMVSFEKNKLHLCIIHSKIQSNLPKHKGNKQWMI